MCIPDTVYCLFIFPSLFHIYSNFYYSYLFQYLLLIHNFLTIYLTLQILSLFIDTDMKPAEDLTSLATLDIVDILTKTQSVSRCVLFNVCQSLLKEWEADLLGVLPEDMIQELLTGVTPQNYLDLTLSSSITTYFNRTFSIDLTHSLPFNLNSFSPTILIQVSLLFLFHGLNLLELATHLEQKAAILRQEGLGHIKIALVGTDTPSFLDILQVHFGHTGLIESSDEEDVPAEEDREEEGAADETNTGKAKEMSNLASAELVLVVDVSHSVFNIVGRLFSLEQNSI